MQCPLSRLSVGKWLENQEQNQRTRKSVSTMTDEAEAIHGKSFDFSVEIAEGGRKLPGSKVKLTPKSNSIDCLRAWRKMRQGNGQCDLVEFCLFVGLLKD